MIGAEASRVIAAARAWVGTPFVHGQAVRGLGCDCLGLVRGVWRELHGAAPAVPAYPPGGPGRGEALLSGLRARMIEVPRDFAAPGALLLFRIAPRADAGHCAVMVDAAAMVHAREGAGVILEALDPPWRRRLAAVFLFPAPRAARLETAAQVASASVGGLADGGKSGGLAGHHEVRALQPAVGCGPSAGPDSAGEAP